jgi:hypothetical protein
MRPNIKKTWNKKDFPTKKVGKKFFVKMKSKKMILNSIYKVSFSWDQEIRYRGDKENLREDG